MSVDLLSGNWQLQYRRPVAHNTRVSCGLGALPRCKDSSKHIRFSAVDHAMQDRPLKIGGQTAATANHHKGEGFLNDNASRVSNLPTMTKPIALVTVGLFGAGTMVPVGLCAVANEVGNAG